MKRFSIILLSTLSFYSSTLSADKIVPFKLPSLYSSSTYISEAQFKGKVVLVNLWASWCGGCKAEMPLLVQLQENFNKRDFVVLLSNIDSDANNAKMFLHDVDPNKHLTCLYDQDKVLPKSYKTIGMPSSYLINKDGEIVEQIIGSLDEETFQKLQIKIQKLIKE